MSKFNRTFEIDFGEEKVYTIQGNRLNQVHDIQPRDFFNKVHRWPVD
jgi:hypothetical protein